MKKAIAIMTLISVIALPVAGTAMGSSYNLNIQQALDLSAENSKQKELDDLNISIQEVNLREAQFISERPDSGTPLERAWKEGIEPVKVEGDLEVAKRTKEDNLNALKLDTYKACLDLILANMNRANEGRKLEIAREKYQMAKTQFEQGRITEMDLLEAEFQVDNKSLDVENAAQKQEAGYLELKRILNLDIALDDVTLEDMIQMEGIKDINVKDLFAQIKGGNTSVYAAEMNLKIKEKNLEETKKLYVNNEFEYEMANFDTETAKYELNNSKIKLDVEMQNKYNELLSMKDNADLALEYSGLMDKQLEAAKLKYELGVSSRQDFLTMEEKHIDAGYQKNLAISNFLIKKAEFENLTKQNMD